VVRRRERFVERGDALFVVLFVVLFVADRDGPLTRERQVQ
jgi:hypothetical protein